MNLFSKLSEKRNTSIKRKFIFFSVVLFATIVVLSSLAFVISMRQIVYNTTGKDLSLILEIERIKLESSVYGEIAIAMKMAGSPLIKRYLTNPNDQTILGTALEEIASYRSAFAANTVFWVSDTDKRFHSDDGYVFTIDTSDPNNYWYLMTLNETEVYNFNINYNPDLNVTNLWINAPVFDNNRRPIGILGTGIDLTAFTDSIYKNYTGTASLYFFNDAGEITGARDPRLIADKKIITDELGPASMEVINNAKKLKAGETIFYDSQIGEIAIGTVPALDWYIIAVQPVGIRDALDTP